MEIMTDSLINHTILSVFIVALTFFFTALAVSAASEPLPAILFSFVSGFWIAVCIVFFLKGIIPFMHGVHIPFKGILVLIPLCSVPLIPFVGYHIEITRNVIIDSLIVGGLLALFIAVMGTGSAVVSYQEYYGKTFQSITFTGLFLGVIIRAILWALERR